MQKLLILNILQILALGGTLTKYSRNINNLIQL